VGLYYLDASALVRWAEGQSDAPTPEQRAAASRVEEIIVSGEHTVAISELTFIEFHDSVLRYRSSPMREWTDAWVQAVQFRVMEWIESGSITVHPPAPRAIDVAVSYISMTRRAGRSLKAGDAIHLNRVIDWARENGEAVVLMTGDRGFERFLETFPAAARFVTLETVVVTQDEIPGTPL
jgi:hypothetical protein